jgi:Outer membrane protein beta-barrel domain
MKKIYLLSALFLATSISNAQVLISLLFGDKLNSGKIEFGLDGGLSLSTLQHATNASYRSGLNLGFYFDIKTKNPAWMISTGVVVKGPMGAKGLPVYSLNDPTLDAAFTNGTVTTQLGYFYVPVSMKYTFKNRIFLKGGIQMGLINKSKDQFLNKVVDEEDLTYTLNRKGDFHPLDGGLVAGIGYRLTKGYGMNVGINYYHGLVDAVIDDNTPNQYNRAWYFNVGIPIGKGKAEKKQKQKK